MCENMKLLKRKKSNWETISLPCAIGEVKCSRMLCKTTDNGCKIGGQQSVGSCPENWIFTQKSTLKEHLQWEDLLITSLIDFLRLLYSGLGNVLWDCSSQLIFHPHSLTGRDGWLHLGAQLGSRLFYLEHWHKTRLYLFYVAVLHYHT